MIQIPKSIAIITKPKICSSTGNPGGGGGLLAAGAGGVGPAKTSTTPSRLIIKTKKIFTIVFILSVEIDF
jgi:hypothetical protein